MMCRARYLVAVALGLAMLAANQEAWADRMGGPLFTWLDVPPQQAVYVDVPFVGGQPTFVQITGGGQTRLQLFVYDADGNWWKGRGFGFQARKQILFRAPASALYRIEIRNLGAVPNSVLLRTN
jgi:hypothetical protein